MFRLGMPTLMEFHSLEENISLCKELGLDFIELNMDLPIFTPETLSAEELNRYRKEYQVDFTVHLPEEFNFTSFHPAVRRGHIERCKEAIVWASAANIKILNMHINNGIYFTMPDSKIWVNEKFENEFLSLFRKSYQEILEFAVVHGVKICHENTRNFYLPFIEKGLEDIRDLNGFYLTWDVGHDAKCDFRETPIFESLMEHIVHMHLHDFNEKGDHQELYTGMVPINDRLRLAEKNELSVVIEIKTSQALRNSVEKIKRK